MSCDGESDVRMFLIFAAIVFIFIILFYLSTHPVRYVDDSFLNDPSFTPSRHFVEKIFKSQNPRHFLTEFYLPPSDEIVFN